MADLHDTIIEEVCRPLSNTRCLPPVKLSTPVFEFMEQQADLDIVPACSEILRNKSTQSPSLQEIEDCYKDAGRERELFLQAMEEFVNKAPAGYQLACPLRGKHSWDEVLKEAKAAQDEYLKKADKANQSGKIRACLRSFQNKTQFLEAWLGLIPSALPFSDVLCVGIKLILNVSHSMRRMWPSLTRELQAATKISGAREATFTALAAIPDEIEDTKAYIDMVRDQDSSQVLRLHGKIATLYQCIIAILDRILKWLKQNCVCT